MMGLGELEAAVMDILWNAGTEESLRVRDVMERMDPPRTLAYTTVMTVLDNLHTKAMVTRARVGRAYLYRAAHSREETTAELVREILRSSGAAEGAMLHFAGSATEDESRILRRAARRTSSRRDGTAT